MTKKVKKVKMHNPMAQDLHTNGLFKPKVVDNKKAKIKHHIPRKDKHKGKQYE